MNDSRTETRILIAVAHPVVRARLRSVLESNGDFAIVGEVSNATQAVALAREMAPDVLLLDADIGPQSGLEVLREISTFGKRIRVILLTADLARNEILSAVLFGARGVLRKNSTASVLLKSIQCVMNEEPWISRKFVGDLVDKLREASPIQPPERSALSKKPAFREPVTLPGQQAPKTKSAKQAKARASIAGSGWKKYGLTRRELEIINAVVNGQSNRAIAATCTISEATVKHHLMHIFDKVGVHSRLELAVLAIHHKLIIFPDE
jgi:two-component system, NarL family, nitrate/nitrite response regulator NarL